VCIEAKHSRKPFGPSTDRDSSLGELTHIDLWGKYNITSINGSYYYLLMVDNAARYNTIVSLKSKDQAAQHVINYLTQLPVRNNTPRAIRID
jgi:hypothetical protein